MTDKDDLWTPPTLKEWLDEVKEVPAWVLPDWIPERGLVLMSGHQKLTKKTWLAMVHALAIASGKQLGPFKAERQGDVLFIEEEGTEADTRYRWLGLCATYKLPVRTLKNIHFAFRQGVGLDVQRWREDLVSYVERYAPVVTFFDNLTFLHSGDENRSSDMRPVLDTIKEVRNAGCACVFLAHLNKQHGDDPRANHDKQVRGSSIISNSYDVHQALRNYEKETSPVEAHLYYRGQQGKRWLIKWDVKSEGVVVHSASVRLDEWYDDEDPRFAEMCIDRMDASEEYTLVELGKLWRVARKATHNIIHVLMDTGRLERTKTGHYSKV
jgi:RecA-family ATPase